MSNVENMRHEKTTVFEYYDRWNPGAGGKEVQPGPICAQLYQNSFRGFKGVNDLTLRRRIPARALCGGSGSQASTVWYKPDTIKKNPEPGAGVRRGSCSPVFIFTLHRHTLCAGTSGIYLEKEYFFAGNQDMKPAIIRRLHKNFEDYVHAQEGVEFWFARDLQTLLGYDEWRNFLKVIEKAKESCEKSGNIVPDHFVDANKMVSLGSGAKREIEDLLLTRYACYLIAQNGDPRKEEIAFAQSYFAVQTRKQEIIEDHIRLAERLKARKQLKDSEKELSRNIYERGVDESGFARIRSKGDMALFGGQTTGMMKNRLEIPENRPLADFLPTVTITAKNLATEITNFNVTKEDMQGEDPITVEHVQNNQDVRELLLKRGIQPETLPPEEDLIKLERRIKKQEKTIAGRAEKISPQLRDSK